MAGDVMLQHQGRLLDSAGVPLNGAQSIRVSLYADSSASTLLWRKTYSIANVSNGYYAVELNGLAVDNTTDLDDVVGAENVFLGVSIDGTDDLLPRQRVASSAFGTTGSRGPLRGSYTFEEGSGPSTTDQSGERNTMTGSGSGYAWVNEGHTGNAVQFTGTGGGFEATSMGSLELREAVTLEAWVYRMGGDSSHMTVVGKASSYIMGINNGQLQAAIWTDSLSDWSWEGGGAVPLNQWTHVAITYDGWAIRTFVNQELTSMVPYAHGTIGSNSNPVTIGQRLDSPGQNFEGRIDDVKVSADAQVYQGPGMAGMVAMFAGTSCPAGWVKANGSSVNVAAYPGLYSAIGTTYGGSGTTFNVPDLRGEFLRAADDGRGVDSGRSVGSAQAQDWKTFSVAGFTNGTYTHGDVTIPKTGYNTTYPFGGYWSAPGNLLRFQWDTTSEIRPRNVALMSCIKS
jgi:hypothetical protein